MATLASLDFDNTFAQLPDTFYSRVKPTPFAKSHYLVSLNNEVADLIGLQRDIKPSDLISAFSGQEILSGAEPLAMLYAGHQFGHYVPQLGDGRAILLGEVRNRQRDKWDIQLKGSGLTPYSRDGDGRAVLRSTIREYLCSEAMHGLGIPTTRALCIIGSDDEVYREQIETGAILTRVAQSHVRFGSFEVFYYRNQHEQIGVLADYIIANHYPHLMERSDRYQAFLLEVVSRTAQLIAQWQAVGFAHGVMNTDNMSILGHTIDYGPFGFMETYNPEFICNHSDHHGRYAFGQQPNIGLWNLTCLAQALTPLMPVDDAKHCLEQYEPVFIEHYLQLMHNKLGLKELTEQSQDLTQSLLQLMRDNHIDYTRLFRALCNFNSEQDALNAPIRDLFLDRQAFDSWATHYKACLNKEDNDDTSRQQQMKQTNPKFILRNYLAQIAIAKANEKDFSAVEELMNLFKDPYAEHPELEHYAAEPPDWANDIQVSCSS